MSEALDALIATLTLTFKAHDVYEGCGSTGDGATTTYGGHLLGQATAAATYTVESDRALHSLHAYFLRAGKPQEPIEYRVERVRDGRSFATRRVHAFQGEKVIFELMASFAKLEHSLVMDALPPEDFADLPAPETLLPYHELMAMQSTLPFPEEWALREHGVDVRTVNAPWAERGASVHNGIRLWIKANGSVPDDPAVHTALLAYQSDESISDNTLVPFGLTWNSPEITFVSLDHAMWFHRPVRMDEWLFVEQQPITTAQGRGLSTAKIWNQRRELVASVTQEALFRHNHSISKQH